MPNTKPLSPEEIEKINAYIEEENARNHEPGLSDDEKREKLNKLKATSGAKLGVVIMDPGDKLGNGSWDGSEIDFSGTSDMVYDEMGVPQIDPLDTLEIDVLTGNRIEKSQPNKKPKHINAEKEDISKINNKPKPKPKPKEDTDIELL